MYKIKNSILEENGKKIFAVGESYYPSFYPYKYPVPPEGDRVGEMKKDFAMMKSLGFNHVRIAAIGTVKLSEDGSLAVDTPFVEEMLKEAESVGLSISVRLQGYSVNLRDFKDVCMIDADGKPQDLSVWYDFIQTTLCHGGILEDNRFLSEKLSKYYAKYKSVAGFQIYNEPHFPGMEIFDYHPTAIAAYRKWLVAHGEMSEAKAQTYEPPHTRKEQPPKMWALWRLFSQESLSDFLDNASVPAKTASGLPTFTCLTTCTVTPASPYRGADFFANARTSMDLVGYTCYFHAVGEEYYAMNLLLDVAACSAASCGKETWCIELDSRTTIPCSLFNKNTYAVVGSGAKGIVYYQWRGDCRSKGTPTPNTCGIINCDGTKTANFDNAAKMVKFLNEMSDVIINTKRTKSHIGMLYSDYATFFCDACENTVEKRRDPTLSNSYQMQFREVYSDLRKCGYNVDLVDEKALIENVFDIKTLFVIRRDFLSDGERAAVERFIANGGKVFECPVTIADVVCANRGYIEYGTPHDNYNLFCTAYELSQYDLEKPFARCDNPLVALQTLDGDGCKILSLTNISCQNKPQSLTICLSENLNSAVLCTPDCRKEIEISDGRVKIDGLADGGILILS